MKGLMKILVRYVASAAGVALILLVLNFALLVIWLVSSVVPSDTHVRVSDVADGLTLKHGEFVLADYAREAAGDGYAWMMLLDDNGDVIWSEAMPDDLPRSYTVSDVASFSRWYLEDYPVRVWQHPYGLFVLAYPDKSLWKMQIELPLNALGNIELWTPTVLLINVIAAVLLALLLGLRLFRAVKRITGGIEDMSESRKIALPTTGLLGDLADKLNRTAARLSQQEAALQKRDSARTTWIAGVSHDIRTPLSMVMGYASQLETNPQLPEPERKQAGIIRSQSQKIKTLVSDLNLASKLEYDMQPLHMAPFYPAALSRSVVADVLNSGIDPKFAIELNKEEHARSTQLVGDEKLLQRALANLLDNSIRHNPDGCHIAVHVEKEAASICIRVSDDGVGFPEQALAAHMADSDHSAELTTHGLGLIIVHQIVKAHHGTTEISNKPDGGCVVNLRLPVDTFANWDK